MVHLLIHACPTEPAGATARDQLPHYDSKSNAFFFSITNSLFTISTPTTCISCCCSKWWSAFFRPSEDDDDDADNSIEAFLQITVLIVTVRMRRSNTLTSYLPSYLFIYLSCNNVCLSLSFIFYSIYLFSLFCVSFWWQFPARDRIECRFSVLSFQVDWAE